jgi:hypothetical protein
MSVQIEICQFCKEVVRTGNIAWNVWWTMPKHLKECQAYRNSFHHNTLKYQARYRFHNSYVWEQAMEADCRAYESGNPFDQVHAERDYEACREEQVCDTKEAQWDRDNRMAPEPEMGECHGEMKPLFGRY